LQTLFVQLTAVKLECFLAKEFLFVLLEVMAESLLKEVLEPAHYIGSRASGLPMFGGLFNVEEEGELGSLGRRYSSF